MSAKCEKQPLIAITPEATTDCNDKASIVASFAKETNSDLAIRLL